jgi:hypothetical protein
LEISALFSIPFLWFAQNSVENSIGLFGVRDKSFYMSFSGLSTVFLRRLKFFYRETKNFHFGSEIFSRLRLETFHPDSEIFSLGFKLFTASWGSRSLSKGIKTAKS